MPIARPFLFDGSQAGVFHVVSRIYDRKFLLDDEAKEFFLKVVRAYEDLLGVEVLTHCVMSNHFHLLVRVPHRPVDFDLPLEVLVARMERALGEDAMGLLRKQLEFWQRTGLDSLIEQWRQKQIARMFSLSEFVKCVKFRFTRWYNRKTGRKGGLWESRFSSTIMEEEERALRTMAAYIDLNPVRAGKARARRGLVRIIGQMAWPRETAAGAEPWGGSAFPASVERPALVFYRAILGGQGTAQTREDDSVVRRGVSEKTRGRLTTPHERRLAAEVLTCRVQHFTKGVILGSRAFIDGWFAEHRSIVTGRSRTERQRGSKPLGRPALRGLYTLRNPRC